MSATVGTGRRYRLPDWLGGHEVRIERETEHGQVRVWNADHAGTPITLSRSDLVEIVPPSIDDPTPWPLVHMVDECDVKIIVGDDDTGAALEKRPAKLAISLRTAHLVNAGSRDTFNYVVAEVPLSVDEMRLFARTLWQRANVVEQPDPLRSGPIGTRHRDQADSGD